MVIRKLKSMGMTILLVEHLILFFNIFNRITVLDHGAVIAEGEPADIGRNERVIAASISDPPMPLLEVDELHVAYGELEVVKGVSFTVERGEIVTILEFNGAGKTTLLRRIAGLMKPAAGRVLFGGNDILRCHAREIARRGWLMNKEGRQLFPEHTVWENLELGAYPRLRAGKRAEFSESLVDIFELFPRVQERLEQPAGTLKQRRTADGCYRAGHWSAGRDCCYSMSALASHRSWFGRFSTLSRN